LALPETNQASPATNQACDAVLLYPNSLTIVVDDGSRGVYRCHGGLSFLVLDKLYRSHRGLFFLVLENLDFLFRPQSDEPTLSFFW
jgi:hypothetical protein